MYPIALGSVLALALFIEQMWSTRQARVRPPAFRTRAHALAREGRFAEAEGLCREDGSPLAHIVGAALKERGKPRAEIKEKINEVGRRQVAYLERYVDLLGTIAAVEPLMGLLGTVLGLIQAFQKVQSVAAKGGGVNPSDLAGGIWAALITTAAGLLIAIPTYLGYRFLMARINTLVVDMEGDSLELAELIADAPRQQPTKSLVQNRANHPTEINP
jgi:biopolymer transport protein ExbB